ncbi:MAG: hypothetical protein B7Z08_07365, partial [Sphingomonadales bacterium 32-68-7]
MAEESAPLAASETPRRRWRAARVLHWLGGAVLALLLLIALAIAWLHTGSGRQFIVERIARIAPASGLSVEVGRIEGSVLWSATLYDVKLRDADRKLFLEVPEVELGWRPLRFLYSGLDVRHLVIHGGTLYATPRLVPGDPDAPTLPDFDIRVDRFVVDGLKVAPGLLGGAERTIDFRAKANVRKGLVYLDADGALGGGDAFDALVYAEPDGNRFDLDLDYRAPAGGLLANLTGTDEATRAWLKGEGTWTAWEGALRVDRGPETVAAFKLYNRAGTYRIIGQARPGEYLTGLPQRAIGPVASLIADGSLTDSVLDGRLQLFGAGVRADARGVVDLADNRFEDVSLRADLLARDLFGPGLTLTDTSLEARLDGPFRSLVVPHELRVGTLDAGGTVFRDLVQRGQLTYDGTRATIPLDATVARITSGNALVDPRLVGGRLRGTLVYAGNRLVSDNLALDFPGLTARLALVGDLERGAYGLSGPVRASGLAIENLGTVDAEGRIQFRIGNSHPWQLDADFSGRMPRVTNATLANVAGGNIRFRGAVSLGASRPIVFRRTVLSAEKLNLQVDGRVEGSRTTLAGSGRHVDYGAFTVEAAIADDGPRATLVFANPYPAVDLRDVRVVLAPTPDGFGIDTEGQSLLGPFDGRLTLVSPADGATRIGIERLAFGAMSVSGGLTLADGGVTGSLALAGGGVGGTIGLTARDSGQAFDVALTATDAQFRGPTPLAIREGALAASGFIGGGSWTVNGTAQGAGISYGSLFIGRVQGQAAVTDGRGTFAAQVAGRRGSRFELQLAGDAAPEQIRLAARGSYAGRPIEMPRRAVLLRTDDGGWQLQQTLLGFGGGRMLAEGRFGGSEPMAGKLHFAAMPLSLIDAFGGDLGLGGT